MNEHFECEYIIRRTEEIDKELRQHRETLQRMGKGKRKGGRKPAAAEKQAKADAALSNEQKGASDGRTFNA